MTELVDDTHHRGILGQLDELTNTRMDAAGSGTSEEELARRLKALDDRFLVLVHETKEATARLRQERAANTELASEVDFLRETRSSLIYLRGYYKEKAKKARNEARQSLQKATDERIAERSVRTGLERKNKALEGKLSAAKASLKVWDQKITALEDELWEADAENDSLQQELRSLREQFKAMRFDRDLLEILAGDYMGESEQTEQPEQPAQDGEDADEPGQPVPYSGFFDQTMYENEERTTSSDRPQQWVPRLFSPTLLWLTGVVWSPVVLGAGCGDGGGDR